MNKRNKNKDIMNTSLNEIQNIKFYLKDNITFNYLIKKERFSLLNPDKNCHFKLRLNQMISST